MTVVKEARALVRQPAPSVRDMKAALKGLLNLIEIADKAIYAVEDGDIALVCDDCAVKYFKARHRE